MRNPFSTRLSGLDIFSLLQESALDYLITHQPPVETSKHKEAPSCPECASTMIFDRSIARGGKYRCKNPACTGDFH